MKTLFLVISPESSGNHVVEGMLSRMGCWGAKHAERDLIFDFLKGNKNISFLNDIPIVFMRSIPDRDVYIDSCFEPVQIIETFKNIGYNIKTIVPIRSWSATVKSNYREKTIEDSIDILEKSWVWLGNRLSVCQPFYFFCTSFLFKCPMSAIKELEIITGLKWKDYNNIDYIKDPDLVRHFELMSKGIDVKGEKDLVRRKKYERKKCQ